MEDAYCLVNGAVHVELEEGGEGGSRWLPWRAIAIGQMKGHCRLEIYTCIYIYVYIFLTPPDLLKVQIAPN